MATKIKSPQKLISIVVVTSYFCKATVKLISGLILSIPPLIADGLHGFIDIAEHGFLVMGGYTARKQIRHKYPIDRQPLLDLLGIIIFSGLIVLGISMIMQSYQLIANVSVYFGWIEAYLTDWITSDDNSKLLSLESNHLLIGSLVMLSSYLISEFVYRFEFRLAVENHIPEMRADAIELRSDGWLELGLGISLLIAWILNFLLSDVYETTHLYAISTLVMGIIALGLGLYLLKIALPELHESYKNLMNQAINEEKRSRLEQEINKRLPPHCSITSPLIGYHRGSQLFIKGYIQIDRNLMQSSDIIISNCEKLTKMFLAETRKEVHSQFSPIFSWSKETILEDLNKVLESIFKVDILSPQAEAFRSLRFGKLDLAIELINSNQTKNSDEEVLGIFILAECYLQKYGPQSELTIKLVNIIKHQYLEINNNDVSGILYAWILIYYVKYYGKNGEGQAVINKFQKEVNDILKNDSSQDYTHAELYFALGFSWERKSHYDLNKSRQLYNLSEYYYIKSGLRSEVDRLMNTIGHMESLLFSLADADIHLNIAKDIRESKNDKLGLSYTYGSLGDLYVKMGLFKDAIECYEKDTVLLKDLGIDHFLSSLNVKIGELKIKIGALNNDAHLVLNGIELCQKSTSKLSDSFFAKKGTVKGYLCFSSLNNNDNINDEHLNKAAIILKEMEPNNSYQKAFYSRLSGRYEGMIGNYERAKELLELSKLNFNEMRDPIFDISNGMQEIVSSLEAFKWGNINSDLDLSDLREIALNDIREFIESIGGMLGSSKYHFEELLDTICKRKFQSKDDFYRQIDTLIWHLEG